MESKREEAAPTFPTWKRRLEEAPESRVREEVDRFLDILKAVGTPMIDGTTVHFLYYGPEAQRVVLTGEFTQWGRRGIPLTPLAKTGIFYHSMEIRGPVRVEYKFIVDGQWKLDPFCPNKVITVSANRTPSLSWEICRSPRNSSGYPRFLTVESRNSTLRARYCVTAGECTSTCRLTMRQTQRNASLLSTSMMAASISPVRDWLRFWITWCTVERFLRWWQ